MAAVSEGTKQKYSMKLSELDIQIMLEALGAHQIVQENRRQSTKATRILIDRVYRAIGVRI